MAGIYVGAGLLQTNWSRQLHRGWALLLLGLVAHGSMRLEALNLKVAGASVPYLI